MRWSGSIEKYPTEPKPIYVNLPTNKEREKKYVKYGRFKFKLEGKEYILQIYRPLGGGELFLPFKDKTSGNRDLFRGTLSQYRAHARGKGADRFQPGLQSFL